MGTQLEVTGLSHSYGSHAVLSDITLAISSGVTALIGVNGAGKSTFLTIAAGGLRPSQGEIRCCGSNLYDWRERRRGLPRVALMPQTSAFPGNMRAQEVVEYLCWMRGMRARQARIHAQQALAAVQLSDMAKTPMKKLSGGMARRVALAQAVATKPDVLLLDEPSTGLDPQQRRVMVDRLSELSGAIMLSSHVMEDVVDLAERVIVLHEGQCRFDGSLEQLKTRAASGAESRSAESGFLSIIS